MNKSNICTQGVYWTSTGGALEWMGILPSMGIGGILLWCICIHCAGPPWLSRSAMTMEFLASADAASSNPSHAGFLSGHAWAWVSLRQVRFHPTIMMAADEMKYC